tara:strand:- start:2542 stop:3678 length:1137 start_codon:yes stop_codon:yes gene_type:complete
MVLKYVDLFCGAGGLSYGMLLYKHELIAAFDKDSDSIKTYNINHKNNKVLAKVLDIVNIEEELAEKAKNMEVDVVLGGPPCQGFSTANRQNIIDDPRNELYKFFIKFIEMVRPKVVLIENVMGMKSKIEDIFFYLNKIGYNCEYSILQAADYGVPQNRKRLFIIASCKKRVEAKFPESFFLEIKKSTLKKSFVLGDALFGLRDLTTKKKKGSREEDYSSGFNIEDSKIIVPNKYLKLINENKKITKTFNHKARYNNDRDIEIFRRLPQGADSTHESISDIMPYKKRNNIFKDKYYKLKLDSHCKTITSHMKFDCNMYIHPTSSRGLTPREAARVQSFPDFYFFEGSMGSCYNQIGNAVPPLLSKVLAKTLTKLLTNRY